jgi:hypothetical protein
MTMMTNEPDELLRVCDDLIDRLDVLLGAIEPMAGNEIRRLPKIARRREAFVDPLADLCEEHGLDGVGGNSVDEMRDSYAEVGSIRLVLEKFDLVRARLDAKRLRAEANLADRLYSFYELARRAARGSEAVRASLEPVMAAFRPRRRRSPELASALASRVLGSSS